MIYSVSGSHFQGFGFTPLVIHNIIWLTVRLLCCGRNGGPLIPPDYTKYLLQAEVMMCPGIVWKNIYRQRIALLTYLQVTKISLGCLSLRRSLGIFWNPESDKTVFANLSVLY